MVTKKGSRFFNFREPDFAKIFNLRVRMDSE